MENATKALLIAGSILIAILLIAMGVRVFTVAKGPTDETEASMKTVEMGQFNIQFTQFIGNNKSKAEAMSLVNHVISHNNTNKRKVSIQANITGISPNNQSQAISATNNTSTLNTMLNYIANSNKTVFSITIQEYDADGYIAKMKISC